MNEQDGDKTGVAADPPWVSHPDGYGCNTGECGDTVELFLKVQDHKIQAAHYASDGCMATHLCALAMVELITGRGLDHAWRLKPDHILSAVPDLPPDHYHCAELAAGALYRALTDLRHNHQKPWAKLYRNPRQMPR
jgi:nitrogen fixation NifU-like protein